MSARLNRVPRPFHVLSDDVLKVIRELKRAAPAKKRLGYIVVRRRLRGHGVQGEGAPEQGA